MDYHRLYGTCLLPDHEVFSHLQLIVKNLTWEYDLYPYYIQRLRKRIVGMLLCFFIAI